MGRVTRYLGSILSHQALFACGDALREEGCVRPPPPFDCPSLGVVGRVRCLPPTHFQSALPWGEGTRSERQPSVPRPIRPSLITFCIPRSPLSAPAVGRIVHTILARREYMPLSSLARSRTITVIRMSVLAGVRGIVMHDRTHHPPRARGHGGACQHTLPDHNISFCGSQNFWRGPGTRKNT